MNTNTLKVDRKRKRAERQVRDDDAFMKRVQLVTHSGIPKTPGQEIQMIRLYITKLDELMETMIGDYGKDASDAVSSLRIEKLNSIRRLAKVCQGTFKPDL